MGFATIPKQAFLSGLTAWNPCASVLPLHNFFFHVVSHHRSFVTHSRNFMAARFSMTQTSIEPNSDTSLCSFSLICITPACQRASHFGCLILFLHSSFLALIPRSDFSLSIHPPTAHSLCAQATLGFSYKPVSPPVLPSSSINKYKVSLVIAPSPPRKVTCNTKI